MALPPQMLAANAAPPAADAPRKPKKKGQKMSARSVVYLREAGWVADVVEQRLPIPGMFVTRDLFGLADVFAVNEHLGALLVQSVAAGGDVNKHIAKIEADEKLTATLRTILRAGVFFCIHGWAKRGLQGERKVWKPRIVWAHVDADEGVVRWEEERDV